ncbi:TRAP transporter substrate-binding protein DctP [Ferruginivarius sediminum]|uniref:Helix-turn-helix domain-containing protein n=1 Tax=Ferruginivarius sediminum TaxID=2661937 RepID=A0A369TEZ2_9PROT|nr:TRAP transporter substrate-binding protein DctP [Ferruginivarius sediminum]RDD63838.1 helix-turn-helix domain-containing protein [Ferruginivarius sediminum]
MQEEYSAPSEDEIQRRVGMRLRELRQAQQLRVADLARRANISQGQLSKIETGKATLSIRTLSYLCDILDRPLSYLFQSDDEMPKTLGVVGTSNEVEGPESRGVKAFVEETADRTGQRMSLLPLRPSQLGLASEHAVQLGDGLIDILIEDIMVFGSVAPGLLHLALPYTFDDDAHQQRFLRSVHFEEAVKRRVEDRGILFLNTQWNWIRGLEWVVCAKTPVRRPEDVTGMRVRVQELEVLDQFWRLLGAEPVALPWAEVAGALRDGKVDAVSTYRSHLYPMGFCRHAPYVTRLGSTSPVVGVAMNKRKFQALPPGVQSALLAASEATGPIFSRIVEDEERENMPRNIEEHFATYLQVAIGPWKRAIEDARQEMISKGLLPDDTWSCIRASTAGQDCRKAACASDFHR